jgi:hypothetical protein
MARKRLIDTEELYFDSDMVELLGARGLHLYIRLWGIAEDWGGYEPRYSDIALKMGALIFKPKEVEKFINMLVDKKKILPYKIDGSVYHWLVNLMKHQTLDNPAAPKLPLPEWISCVIKQYPSGKKYAEYQVIPSKLPVGYSSATRNGVTNSNSNVTVKKETESKERVVKGKDAASLQSRTFLKDLNDATDETLLSLKGDMTTPQFKHFLIDKLGYPADQVNIRVGALERQPTL